MENREKKSLWSKERRSKSTCVLIERCKLLRIDRWVILNMVFSIVYIKIIYFIRSKVVILSSPSQHPEILFLQIQRHENKANQEKFYETLINLMLNISKKRLWAKDIMYT